MLNLGMFGEGQTFLILGASPSPMAAAAGCPHTPRSTVAASIRHFPPLLSRTVPLAAPIIAVSAGYRLVPVRGSPFCGASPRRTT
jgi:hypothetical protein